MECATGSPLRSFELSSMSSTLRYWITPPTEVPEWFALPLVTAITAVSLGEYLVSGQPKSSTWEHTLNDFQCIAPTYRSVREIGVWH